MSEVDCRNEVFRERGYEVLGSVVQGTQIDKADQYDVATLYAHARQAFNTTLDLVRKDATSRILLITGESGCGKTHLVRALRTQIHAARRGIVAYVHMTSELVDYRQYLLRQVVRSMSDPYLYQPGSASEPSALDLLSDGLMDLGALEPDAAEKLRDADEASLPRLVSDYADELSELLMPDGRARFADIDLNTLRILLYRQSTRLAIRRRVDSFLNGQSMGEMDWARLSALPRECNRSPMFLLGQLARLSNAVLDSPLIICVDQIEASDITNKSHVPFVNAMSTACELIENVPRLMILLSCLDSSYEHHAPQLIQSYRHRIEHDPAQIRLMAGRTAAEIRQIVSRRLKWLYENHGLEHAPPDSVFPLPETLPEQLRGQKLRDVIKQIHAYQQQCHLSGDIVPWTAASAPAQPAVLDDTVDRLQQAWNDFYTAGNHQVAENDAAHLDLLTWAIGQIPAELAEPANVNVRPLQAPVPALDVSLHMTRTLPVRRCVGLCEKDPRGNGLLNQITALQGLCQAPNQQMVIVRSTSFPAKGKTLEHLATLERAGHLRLKIEQQRWETMQALRSFLQTQVASFSAASVSQWRKANKPLSNLPEIIALLHLDAPAAPVDCAVPIRAETEVEATIPLPEAAMVEDAPENPTPSRPTPDLHSALVIGKTVGFSPADATLDPLGLRRHTAIFGSNGSGKTVLAMTIVEMLLERGVSAIAFDRKGDLCRYASSAAWTQNTGAPDESTRRASLRAGTQVHVYTPGAPQGRPLSLPLLPAGLAKLSDEDRDNEVHQAAMILNDICLPTKAKADQYVTIFGKAIELLCADEVRHTPHELEKLLLEAPSELLERLPAHDAGHCKAVGQRLNERRNAYGRLFDSQGESLDVNQMLQGSSGRARLNIISTQFLDDGAALVWIAQFLAAVGRYIREFPAPGSLQGLLMFDEADAYIPAVRKPATKAGMEHLLKRARAAGIAILLCTQSSGDFDYKALDNVGTVFGGKLTTKTALDKLRARLGDSVDKLARIAKGHFVMAGEGTPREISANMCLINPDPLPREEILALARQKPG